MKDRVFLVRVAALRLGIDEPAQISAMVTEHAPDTENMQRYAKQHGVQLTVDVEQLVLVAGNGLSDVATWIDRCVAADPTPVVKRDRTEILIDEMTRGMRKQERRISELTDLVGQLANVVGALRPVIASQPQQQPRETTMRGAFGAGSSMEAAFGAETPVRLVPVVPVRDNPTEVDWRELERNPGPPSPHRHIEYGAESVKDALAENMKPGVNGIVPGNMSLRGAPATSEMYMPGVGDDGQPGVRVALPKVGDTLKVKPLGED